MCLKENFYLFWTGITLFINICKGSPTFDGTLIIVCVFNVLQPPKSNDIETTHEPQSLQMKSPIDGDKETCKTSNQPITTSFQ